MPCRGAGSQGASRRNRQSETVPSRAEGRYRPVKTGLHLNSLAGDTEDGGLDRVVDYYRRSQSKMLKAMEFNREFFQEIKRVSPGCVIVGRNYDSDQRLDNDAQERFINRVVALSREYPEVDLWEGYNECYSAAGEGIDRFAQMEVNRLRALPEGKSAVACFSTGRPPIGEGNAGNDNWEAWRQFMPAIHETIRRKGVLQVHEYDAPWMSRLVEGNLWDTTVTGWLCLRYRKVVRWLVSQGIVMYHPVTAPNGLRLMVGEGGVDGGVTNRPGPPGGGWAHFTDWPDPLLGDYAQQRRWYMWQASHDAYVLGVTSFGERSMDPTWFSFSALKDTGMLDKIVAAEADLPLYHFASAVPAPVPGDQTMSERLSAMLRAEFGDLYDDLRGKLRTNPGGPNGNFGKMNLAIVDGIAVHHTAGPEAITWEATADYHVLTRKFAGIGYHGGIRNGRVALFAEIDTARAHVADENHHLIGWVTAGNYQNDALDPNDVALLRRVIKVLDAFLGRKVRIGGHRDFTRPGYTVCPGTALYAQVPSLRLPEPPPTPGEDLTTLYQALGKWADLAQAQGIQPNPTAALFKAIQADNFYLLTDESGARGQWPEVEIPGVVAQLARRSGGSQERIYYWHNGAVKWRLRG